MLVKLRKILLLIGCVLFSFSLTSCNNDKTTYEAFRDNYYEHHPKGYDVGYEWYDYSETFRKENSDSDLIMLNTVSFTGYIDFENNGLHGKTSKFVLNRKYTTIENGKITYEHNYSAYLNNGNYYERSEKKTDKSEEPTIITKGCSNVETFDIYAMFSLPIYIFNVDRYQEYIPTFFDSMTINSDYVSFDNSAVKYYEDTYHDQKSQHYNTYLKNTGYFYDENYNFTSTFLYYNEMDKCITPDGVSFTSEVDTQILSVGKEIEIDVPTDYDETFTYDDNYQIDLFFSFH